MKGYLRFLQPGFVEVELPEDFETWPPAKQLVWGSEKLSLCTDEELIDAMSDYSSEGRARFGFRFFDYSPLCEAVEISTPDYEPITRAWTKDWESWAFNNNSDEKGLVGLADLSKYYGEIFADLKEEES